MKVAGMQAPTFGASFWGVRVGSVLAALLFCFALNSFASGLTPFYARLVLLAGLYVTLAVSLNLINGITGQFSIGHAAFYQVGAYAAGYLTVTFYKAQPLSTSGWFIVMVVAGGIAASLAGVVVGLPSLRLRGDYLAVVTLGFGEIIRIVTQNIKEVGAASGLKIEPNAQSTSLVWLAWGLAIVCVAVCRNLIKNAHGLPFLAVREDEVASSAMGVNVTKTKVIAFVIGSAFAGAAGSIYALNEGFILPAQFTMEISFMILTMVVLGGTGSITGSVFAAVLLSALPELLSNVKIVTMPSLAGIVIAIGVMVAVMRRVQDKYFGDMRAALGPLIGCIGLAVVVWLLAKFGLSQIPGFKDSVTEGSRLRMLVFAGALLILMMLRPQGVFGHHEFNWSWLKRKEAA